MENDGSEKLEADLQTGSTDSLFRNLLMSDKAEFLTVTFSALWSGSSDTSLRRRPLRTVRAPHNAYGSSLSKAFSTPSYTTFFSSVVNNSYSN